LLVSFLFFNVACFCCVRRFRGGRPVPLLVGFFLWVGRSFVGFLFSGVVLFPFVCTFGFAFLWCAFSFVLLLGLALWFWSWLVGWVGGWCFFLGLFFCLLVFFVGFFFLCVGVGVLGCVCLCCWWGLMVVGFGFVCCWLVCFGFCCGFVFVVFGVCSLTNTPYG